MMSTKHSGAIRQEIWRMGTTLYMFTVFPCALLITLASLFFVRDLITERAWGPLAFYSLCWMAVFLPLTAWLRGVIERGRVLRRVVGAIRSPDCYDPAQEFECYHEGDGRYLGIDPVRGSILFVQRVHKGKLNVVALSMDDWTTRELEGNRLRLYTNHINQPFIDMWLPSNAEGERWYATLGAMENRNYNNVRPFAAHVADSCSALEGRAAGYVLQAA